MKKSISPRSLNTDDNKLSLGPDESKFSLNIDSEGFGEDESGVVKHVRGNSAASFSDESITLPVGDNRVVGSVSDEQLNVVYFFVHNSQDQHSIVAYNSKTNTYRTVFVSPDLDFRSDGFVKADIVRLRRVPDDLPLSVEPPEPPEVVTPVALQFFIEIDLSPWGELNGFKSSDIAPSSTNALQVRFESQNGTRIYESGETIFENSLSQSFIDVSFKTNDSSNDGWVKFGTFTVHVHPDDISNPSRTLTYKVSQPLQGTLDVARHISNNQMISASGDTVTNLGKKCYGFNKDIGEMMVSDLYSGLDEAIQSSTTQTGRLLDRKVKVNFGCDYSKTEAWEETLLFESSEYNDNLSGSGLGALRSHPTERMDNGGDGPSIGPGGGGGGGSDSITLTYCDVNWPANGADYETAQDALQGYYDNYQGLSIAVEIVNACPDPEGFGDLILQPSVFVHDTIEGITSFASSTAVEFNPFLLTIPEEYDFEIDVHASSCGTMRRQSSIVFGGAGEEGAPGIEFLPSSAQSGYNIFWSLQSDLGGIEFGDVVSDIDHNAIPFELLQDQQTGNIPNVIMRSFEISVGIGFGQGQILSDSSVLQDGGFKAFLQQQGSPFPTQVTYLCFGSNNECTAEVGGAPPPSRDLSLTEVPEVIEDTVVVPETPTEVVTTESDEITKPIVNIKSDISKAKIAKNISKSKTKKLSSDSKNLTSK